MIGAIHTVLRRDITGQNYIAKKLILQSLKPPPSTDYLTVISRHDTDNYRCKCDTVHALLTQL